MDIGYWLNFLFVFVLGIALVQISHGKLIDNNRFKFSTGFLKILRYLGLFIIIYSCYGVLLDYIIN